MDDNGYLGRVGGGQVAQQPEELVDCLFFVRTSPYIGLEGTQTASVCSALARVMSFVLHLPSFLVINPPNLPTAIPYNDKTWSRSEE